MITDPVFYAVSVPAVLLLGISKSGFGAGFGSLAVPMMAMAVTVPEAAAILMPVLLVMDVLGMAGITGAGMHLGLHRMGNGANLAYQKSAFEQVGGYAGNRHIASGDDMFLLQKMAAEWPDGVAFLKNPQATVLTTAQSSWKAFWRQRLRWGGKNAALPEWPIRLILLAILLGCWSIWLGIAFWALGWVSGFVLLGQILLKAGADYWLLSTLATYFGRRDLLRWFWPSLVLHTAYVALIGLASVWYGLTKHRAVSAPQGRRSHADKWV